MHLKSFCSTNKLPKIKTVEMQQHALKNFTFLFSSHSLKIVWNQCGLQAADFCTEIRNDSCRPTVANFFFYYLICVFQKFFWKALYCPCIQGQEGLAAMKKCKSRTNNAILCLLFTTPCASEMRLGSIRCLQRVTHISHTVPGCWKHWASSFRNDSCPHPIGALTDVTNAWAQGGLCCLQPFSRQLFCFVL